LTDHEAYPANELVELYHQRWELEVGFDEIKTHMLERKESLRSKKLEGVYQELWGLRIPLDLGTHSGRTWALVPAHLGADRSEATTG
jgi:hypothetical protein